MFETPFQPALMPVVVLFAVVCLLTIIIGLANSRGILNRSPTRNTERGGSLISIELLLNQDSETGYKFHTSLNQENKRIEDWQQANANF